jgi:hypothetical protein
MRPTIRINNRLIECSFELQKVLRNTSFIMIVEYSQNKSGVNIWQVIIRLTLTMQHLSIGPLARKVVPVGSHLIIRYHQ